MVSGPEVVPPWGAVRFLRVGQGAPRPRTLRSIGSFRATTGPVRQLLPIEAYCQHSSCTHAGRVYHTTQRPEAVSDCRLTPRILKGPVRNSLWSALPSMLPQRPQCRLLVPQSCDQARSEWVPSYLCSETSFAAVEGLFAIPFLCSLYAAQRIAVPPVCNERQPPTVVNTACLFCLMYINALTAVVHRH